MSIVVRKSVFDLHNGLACLYKNPKQSNFVFLNNFKLKLQLDASARQRRAPLRSLIRIRDENIGTNKSLVAIEPDYSSHPLAQGQVFEIDEFECNPIDPLSKFASGVQVVGVNDGGFLSRKLADCLPVRVYRIDAFFGRATRDGTVTGKLMDKTPWRNVKRHRLEKWLNALQAEHQKLMFTYAGVSKLSSPEAYRLACSGLIRPPHAETPPVLYGIKCISFNLPMFTLEIHAINETVQYLADIVHNLGARLKSSACCLKIRRIQYGPFTLHDALLDRQWTIDSVAQNMEQCSKKGLEVIKNLSRDTISSQFESESQDAIVDKFIAGRYNFKI